MNVIEAAKAMKDDMIVRNNEDGICYRFDPISCSGQIVRVSGGDSTPLTDTGYQYYPSYMYLNDLLSDKWEVVGRVGDTELINKFGRLAK